MTKLSLKAPKNGAGQLPPAKRAVRTAGARKVNGGPAKKVSKTWTLRLYIAGQTPKSVTALANLKRLCEKHLPGQYRIEVLDLLKHPELAENDQIVVIPTLIRKLPEPLKRIIGDLSDAERTMVGLDILHNSSII